MGVIDDDTEILMVCISTLSELKDQMAEEPKIHDPTIWWLK